MAAANPAEANVHRVRRTVLARAFAAVQADVSRDWAKTAPIARSVHVRAGTHVRAVFASTSHQLVVTIRLRNAQAGLMMVVV